MEGKAKVLLRVSIVINLLLLILLVWGYFTMQYVTERTLTTNVGSSLFGLEAKINYQEDKGWVDPLMVNMEIAQALSGISHTQNVGAESQTLSDKDSLVLTDLSYLLTSYLPYPLEELEDYTKIEEDKKEALTELAELLKEEGFDTEHIDDFEDWSTEGILTKIAKINKEVKVE